MLKDDREIDREGLRETLSESDKGARKEQQQVGGKNKWSDRHGERKQLIVAERWRETCSETVTQQRRRADRTERNASDERTMAKARHRHNEQ